jgi:ABC-type multidrug transport system permease subunit
VSIERLCQSLFFRIPYRHPQQDLVVGKISQLLPATQAMNAFRGLAMGQEADFAPWGSVILLLLSGLLAFGLALYLVK